MVHLPTDEEAMNVVARYLDNVRLIKSLRDEGEEVMKLTYELTVIVNVTTEGGRPDPEDISDKVGDDLVDLITELIPSGECLHATKDDDFVQFTGEVAEVLFGHED
jgi:hypothetical protein